MCFHFLEGELYTVLLGYKASEQDLLENGYPAFSLDFPDKVLIKSRNPLYNSTIKLPTSDRKLFEHILNFYSTLFFVLFLAMIRTCCRCGKTYRVTPEGDYVNPEECWHHWGRLRPQRGRNRLKFVQTTF